MSEVVKAMSEEELLECLKKFCFNSSMTVDDLRCPMPPFIVTVFQSFLSAIHVNVDFIYTPPFKVTDSIENTEWHEEILPLSSLKVLMTEVIQFSGITDLSIRDILEPKPKRTKKILNYLIALWRYLLIKDSMYEKLEEEYQAEINKKQELSDHIQVMKQQIAGTAKSIEKRKELLCVYKENQAKFELQTKSKDALSEKYQELKSKKASYLKRLRELDVQIDSHKIKLEEIDQKIMKSPERFNTEKEQLKQKTVEVENKTKEIQLKTSAQRTVISNRNDTCELLTKSCESVKTIRCLSEQLCEAAALLDLNQTKYKEEQENAKRMNIELEKEEEKKYLNEQWLAKQNLNGKKRVAAIKEIMTINKQDSEKVESSCKLKQKAVAVLEESLQLSGQTLVNEKEQHETYSKMVTQEYGILKKSLSDYAHNVEKVIESAIQKNVDPALWTSP